MSVEKTCTKCGLSKPISEFSDRDKVRGYKFSACKVCCYKATVISRKHHPERWQMYRRGIDLKYRYGITAKEYNDLLASQNGCCAICNHEPTLRRLAVDHDHNTGKIRGLLCHPCNRTLGHLENKITKMVAYLTPEYGMSGC